jgi:protein-S-isoprenylcysteine O-methyltransferase Ste14
LRASNIEFRLRFWIHLAIYVLGFTAPWNYAVNVDGGRSVWLPAALGIERAGVLSLTGAANALLVAAIVFALAAAWLRTWGTAYLHASVVNDAAMQGGAVVADGPYRHMRNPLYVGTWLHTFALALLMPPSGALFAIVLVSIFQLRLIGGEEAFLEQKQGAAYLAYKARVPRLWPALTPRVAAGGRQPAWGMALLGEIYMWGVVAAFASVGWRYNAMVVTQGVLIALGVSLLARAFIPRAAQEPVDSVA